MVDDMNVKEFLWSCVLLCG